MRIDDNSSIILSSVLHRNLRCWVLIRLPSARYSNEYPHIHFCREIRKMISILSSNEPDHEKMCPMPHANNKDADQSAFIVCCLDNTIPILAISKVSRF